MVPLQRKHVEYQDILKIVGATLASIVSGGALVLAMARWLGQLWINRIIEREKGEIQKQVESFRSENAQAVERLRHAYGKNHYAFTKAYEKEFAVYESLWSAIVEFYSATAALRPNMDFHNPNQSAEDRKKERRARFYDAMTEAKKCILFQKPFYSQKIFDLSQELSVLCSHEISGYEIRNPQEQGREYWEEAEKNREGAIKIAERICDAIRERIKQVEDSVSDQSNPTAKADQLA
jgi:hypothetical protein